MNKLQAEAYYTNLLNGYLSEKGFVLREHLFELTDVDGYVWITFGVNNIGLTWDYFYNVHRRYNSIEKIWSCDYELCGLGNQKEYNFRTLCFNYNALHDVIQNNGQTSKTTKSVSPSIESIDAYFIQFQKELTEDIFPFLNRFNDIRQLDAYLNDPPEAIREKMNIIFPYGLEFRKMIIAKLANNPRYEDVVDAMFTLINGAVAQDCNKYQGLLTAFHNVVERLKTVEPLKNPILGQIL